MLSGCVRFSAVNVMCFSQPPVYSPVKSSRVVLPSAQHTEVPELRPAQATESRSVPSPVCSPQKTPHSRGAIPASPQKTLSSLGSVPQRSPLKTQGLSRGPDAGTRGLVGASPQKSGLPSKLSVLAVADASQSHGRERGARDVTPAQPKANTAGTPGETWLIVYDWKIFIFFNDFKEHFI